ncbi:MAG TPA: peptidoglycan-binding protein [Chthoniobacterales bacterium]|nr:peptidoglycan-binding protein [Chthoniobacterales bacterium]
MKVSDRRQGIIVAALVVLMNGAVALAKENGQGDRARSSNDADTASSTSSAAPAAPSSAARVSAPSYRAVPARYPAASARPGAASRPSSGPGTSTNRPVISRRPSGAVSERKPAPGVVRARQPRRPATDENSTPRHSGPHQRGADRTRATGAQARNSAPDALGARRRLDRHSVDRLRGWRGKGDGVATVRAKHDDHRHHHHNRDWWRHHCDIFVLVGGGFWAWDAGWWYPAWGYNPVYSNYAFDEPVYGYEDLSPDDVMANVQAALQELGYYLDEVDGVLGPTTRAALENYQSDYGLAVTGIIDRETLASLGFIE